MQSFSGHCQHGEEERCQWGPSVVHCECSQGGERLQSYFEAVPNASCRIQSIIRKYCCESGSREHSTYRSYRTVISVSMCFYNVELLVLPNYALYGGNWHSELLRNSFVAFPPLVSIHNAQPKVFFLLLHWLLSSSPCWQWPENDCISSP